MKRKNRIALLATGLIATMPFAVVAQSARQGQAIATSEALSQISMFSYRDGPESDLYFRGTPMSALAEGTAEVEYQDGNARISAKVEKLPKPSSLGPYAVYVLWALTPDGRAVNQGVIAGSDGGRGRIDTEYGASQFALIVTAEPHFAVTVPSEMIALYNVADNVKGTESKVTTLTERSNYSNLARQPVDEAIPTEIVQARYAYAIAGAAGAERFAAQAYRDANAKLMDAEAALAGNRRSERRMAPQLGREAVIASEDTRRAAMIEAAAAASEAERLSSASAATSAANDRAAIDRESTRIRTEADRRRAADSAETARVRAADSAETARVRAADTAETARRQAAASAASAARTDLRNRLNAALPTRESNRGLIAEIGGVQFATGKAEISPSAREGAAQFSGIVASYPELRFSVEGHTDSTGSVATNDALSLQRANAVRSLLISQGVPASSIVVAGFGSTMPTADNATVDGRTRNRRVEIVVSGGVLAAN